MELELIFILGIVIGVIMSNLLRILQTASGTLKIDRTNPNKDVYRLEIGDLDVLSKKKRIILKVDSKAELSQK